MRRQGSARRRSTPSGSSSRNTADRRRNRARGKKPASPQRAPSVTQRLLRLHQHVGSRRIFDRLQLAGAGLTRVDFAVVILPQPLAPFGPPRAWAALSSFEPLLGVGGIILAGFLLADPVSIFIRGGRIDYAGDMTGGGEGERQR